MPVKITAYVTIFSDAEDFDDPEVEKFLQQARQALPGFEVERVKERLPKATRERFPDFKNFVQAKRVFIR